MFLQMIIKYYNVSLKLQKKHIDPTENFTRGPLCIILYRPHAGNLDIWRYTIILYNQLEIHLLSFEIHIEIHFLNACNRHVV